MTTTTATSTTNGTHTDGNAASAKPQIKPPISLAHVVFRTANLQTMTEFWTTFLGGHVVHKDETIAFIRYDEEHHRVALIAVPHTTPRVPTAAGLEHVAFSYASLKDLADSYQARKARGILPHWCINHGPTTSIYYRDPDGNSIETQVDNFDQDKEAADAFMRGDLFRENPIGTDFDPEELVERLRRGEDQTQIKTRIEIGPRGLPENFGLA